MLYHGTYLWHPSTIASQSATKTSHLYCQKKIYIENGIRKTHHIIIQAPKEIRRRIIRRCDGVWIPCPYHPYWTSMSWWERLLWHVFYQPSPHNQMYLHPQESHTWCESHQRRPTKQWPRRPGVFLSSLPCWHPSWLLESYSYIEHTSQASWDCICSIIGNKWGIS